MPKMLFLISVVLLVSCIEPRNDSPHPSQDANKSSILQSINRNRTDEVKLVKKPEFSLYLPMSFVEQTIEVEDSKLWEFGDENITVFVESGLETMTIDRSLERHDQYREEVTTIGGERVKIVSFSYGQESSLLKDPEKSLVLAGHFMKANRDLIVWINFRSERYRPVAMGIVESLRLRG